VSGIFCHLAMEFRVASSMLFCFLAGSYMGPDFVPPVGVTTILFMARPVLVSGLLVTKNAGFMLLALLWSYVGHIIRPRAHGSAV